MRTSRGDGSLGAAVPLPRGSGKSIFGNHYRFFRSRPTQQPKMKKINFVAFTKRKMEFISEMKLASF